MAKPSPLNPLGYITRRQYNDRVNIKRDLFTNRMTLARSLFRKDLLAHYGCVNAIEFSNQGDLLASGMYLSQIQFIIHYIIFANIFITIHSEYLSICVYIYIYVYTLY